MPSVCRDGAGLGSYYSVLPTNAYYRTPPPPGVSGAMFFWNLPVNHRGPGSAHKITSQQMLCLQISMGAEGVCRGDSDADQGVKEGFSEG